MLGLRQQHIAKQPPLVHENFKEEMDVSKGRKSAEKCCPSSLPTFNLPLRPQPARDKKSSEPLIPKYGFDHDKGWVYRLLYTLCTGENSL